MPTTKKQLNALYSLIESRQAVLILTHNDPDPDALGAAYGVSTLVTARQESDQRTDIAFGGILGRAENRTMVRVLNLEYRLVNELEFDEYDCIIMVDCQPGAGNHGLPESQIPDAVIDHHPRLKQTREVQLRDVRPDYGSTCTIVAEYLERTDIEWSSELATALFYGIKTDTRALSRSTSEADADMYLHLYRNIDRDLVAKIEQAPLPRRYFQALHAALSQATVYSNLILVDLDEIHRPDWVAEVADFFLRLDGVQWSVGFGIHDEVLMISVRSATPDLKAGRLVRRAVGARGTAGGHVTMAAGQIPLQERDVEQERERLQRRILKLLDLAGVEGRKLLDVRE